MIKGLQLLLLIIRVHYTPSYYIEEICKEPLGRHGIGMGWEV